MLLPLCLFAIGSQKSSGVLDFYKLEVIKLGGGGLSLKQLIYPDLLQRHLINFKDIDIPFTSMVVNPEFVTIRSQSRNSNS